MNIRYQDKDNVESKIEFLETVRVKQFVLLLYIFQRVLRFHFLLKTMKTCFRVSDPLFSVLRALRMLSPLQARIPLAASIASLPVLLSSLVPVSSVSSQREVAKPTCSAVISTWALTSSHFQRPATTLWPALAWRLSSPSFRQSVKTSARHPSSALSIQSRPQPGTHPRLSASAPLSTPASVRLPSAPLSRIERFPCPRPGLTKYLSTLASLAKRLNQGCTGVSSKCFGEHIV